MKKNRGITLISLVVTIIILLILAGISISLLLGNDGLIARANEAKLKAKISNIKEQIHLYIGDKEIEGKEIEPQLVFNYLKQKNVIDETNKLEGIWIDVDGIKISTIDPDKDAVIVDNNTLWEGGIIDNDEYRIIGYLGPVSEDLIVPDYIDGHLVTSITGSIVKDNSTLKSAVLPESVKNLGGYAFLNNTSLVSVNIPYSTEVLGEGAFLGSKSLSEIKFNKKLQTISKAAFQDCSSLIKVETPKTLKVIETVAFSNCTNLNEIILNDGLETIGNAAFSNCPSVKKLTIGSGIKTISDYVFSNMKEIENDVYIPNSITKIGEQAFLNVGCNSTGTIYINQDGVEIGELAFYNCRTKSYVANVNMKNVKNIADIKKKYCFLTFDDGPSYDNETSKILTILKNYNIKATFFMIGSMAEQYNDSVITAYNDGHYIANHAYSTNSDITYESADSVINEFNKTEEILGKCIGNTQYKSNLFRFPGGFKGSAYKAVKEEAAQKLEESGVYYLDWNVDINDAVVKEDGSRYSVDEMFQRFKDTVNLNSSNVVLMHNFSEKTNTDQVLIKVIEYLKDNDFEFKNMYDLDKIF